MFYRLLLVFINLYNKLIFYQISNGVDECDSAIKHNGNNDTKTRHVLAELLYTERQYSTELGSILTVCLTFKTIIVFRFVFTMIK